MYSRFVKCANKFKIAGFIGETCIANSILSDAGAKVFSVLRYLLDQNQPDVKIQDASSLIDEIHRPTDPAGKASDSQ